MIDVAQIAQLFYAIDMQCSHASVDEQLLRIVIAHNRAGKQQGIYSVCSAHQLALTPYADACGTHAPGTAKA